MRDLRVGDVPVRTFRPEGDGPLPVVAYLHGGGWMMGTLDSYDALLRALANASGAIVAGVDYRLAPEHRYPAALDDSLAAIRWLAAHADELGGDGTRLAVAGDSAGGNLAAVAARRLRGEVRYQALIYPVIDAVFDTPSYVDFDEGHGLSAASMQRFWQLYLDGADPTDPDASPLRADDLAGVAARLRADRRGGRPARRGRGVRRGAARGRRADRAGALAGHDPRLLPLAGGDAGRARGGRRGRRPAAGGVRGDVTRSPPRECPAAAGLDARERVGPLPWRPWSPPQPRPGSGTPSPTWAR